MSEHEKALNAAAHVYAVNERCFGGHPIHAEVYTPKTKAVIDAYLAAMAEAGRKLEPRDPSESMRAVHDDVCYRSPSGAWRIMWDAAPKPEDVG
jgi:hypothetical protein